MFLKSWCVGVALMIGGSAVALDAQTHKAEVEQWRAQRLTRLQQPEGWLSLVGLHWLQPGKQSVGSAPDNDIVLNVGPAHLGSLEVHDKIIELSLADAVQATIGEGTERHAALLPDTSGTPTPVRFGSANFIVIERSGRFALRVKDSQASTLTHFLGMDNFDIDPAWRFDARFEAHPAGKTIDIATVINTIEPMANPGAVVFEKDGKQYRLEAVDEGDGTLFLIFADRTSGKTTYGAGRFLYADAPAAGTDRTVVDFNEAYNPPCVFTPYATCPLPPPENRLDLAVTAGEKSYRGAAH